MRMHFLQHVPFEGIGSMERWFKKNGYRITRTCLYQQDSLPEMDRFDFLVIMGGPMSVNDESEYPWLIQEKAFIKAAVESGKAVLGICLGAQLIANCLGAGVFSGPQKEIGWFPVKGIGYNEESVFQFPQEFNAFHWHGETFDLPKRALRIAATEVCCNQGFQLGKLVIGLQFHLETTLQSARDIVDNCRDELVTGDFIQSESEILSNVQSRYSLLNSLMEGVLEYLHNALID